MTNNNKSKNTLRMGTENTTTLLISMSVPPMLSMLINSLYNIVDSIFVAQISEEAFTAVSLALPIQNFIVSFAVGIGVGINSLVSRRLGADDLNGANTTANAMFPLWIVLYTIFLAFGVLFSESFIDIFSNNDSIISQGADYLCIVSSFSGFLIMQIMIEKVLQSTGNMLWPMLLGIISAITNIIMDPILIFGLLGFPELGVTGAAIATISGQFLGCFIGLIVLFKSDHILSISFKKLNIPTATLKEILVVGLPAAFMKSIASVMLIGYNSILASDTAIAVLGAYFKLQSFVFMPTFGVSQGTLPILGYNFGAKNKERILSTLKSSFLFSLLLMGSGTLLFQLFPHILLSFFNPSEELLTMGIPALRIISICFIPAAFGIVCSTFFQALGHGIYSLISSMIRQLVGILPLAYILLQLGGVTLSWASFPLAEILGFTYTFIMYTKVMKREIKTLE